MYETSQTNGHKIGKASEYIDHMKKKPSNILNHIYGLRVAVLSQ
jgi:hypothetical protein